MRKQAKTAQNESMETIKRFIPRGKGAWCNYLKNSYFSSLPGHLYLPRDAGIHTNINTTTAITSFHTEKTPGTRNFILVVQRHETGSLPRLCVDFSAIEAKDHRLTVSQITNYPLSALCHTNLRSEVGVTVYSCKTKFILITSSRRQNTMMDFGLYTHAVAIFF